MTIFLCRMAILVNVGLLFYYFRKKGKPDKHYFYLYGTSLFFFALIWLLDYLSKT